MDNNSTSFESLTPTSREHKHNFAITTAESPFNACRSLLTSHYTVNVNFRNPDGGSVQEINFLHLLTPHVMHASQFRMISFNLKLLNSFIVKTQIAILNLCSHIFERRQRASKNSVVAFPPNCPKGMVRQSKRPMPKRPPNPHVHHV